MRRCHEVCARGDVLDVALAGKQVKDLAAGRVEERGPWDTMSRRTGTCLRQSTIAMAETGHVPRQTWRDRPHLTSGLRQGQDTGPLPDADLALYCADRIKPEAR